jgi:hypothetical protein
MNVLEELLELEFLSQRYGDMLKTARAVIEKNKTLTARQRQLLEYAFYATMRSRRSSWTDVRQRSDFSTELKEEYSRLIAEEITVGCRMLLNTLYLHLFPNAKNLHEIKAYHLLSSTCYRYIAEVTLDTQRQKELVRQSLTAYSFYSSIDYFEKFAN